MSATDVESVDQDVVSADPCGENLEYDPSFLAMETIARGKPERQVGETIVPAEEPNWRQLRDQARELLGRTKDLRVVVYLTRALVQLQGFSGLRDGLVLLREMLEKYWSGVHPRLDPEDDNDPTMRSNAVQSLCDAETVLQPVHNAILVDAPSIGKFTLHDVQVALGRVPLSEYRGEKPPDRALVDAAFMNCDLEELRACADAVCGSLEALEAISSVFEAQVGTTRSPDLDPLRSLLEDAQAPLVQHLTNRGVRAEVETRAAAETGAEPTEATGEVRAGAIRSREDVVRVLDQLCSFFEQHEPSSPVPLLLQRAKRLVAKSFLDILRDLAPEGVAQTETLAGIHTEKAEE